ncbi:hypothetical protein DMB38_05370 [Streptomyces sp. WAC 06738]|uniref:DUF3099 domain-containing protein n=1 Tax=Streptomyces sp. WAC 06738 TaxID=2203210 RepID=UPI000F716727|nr:DUF3099 domain-containing protein [Streptomyces sp. WAC 06738]AZM45332.1 hypothetical protein DMB38_05370 [Streptomyces sp. WAC 06738]
MKRKRRGDADVFRITGARQSLDDDVRGRQRRYVISMTIRAVSVVAAALLWNVQRHTAVVALILGMFIPYFAVIIANAGRESIRSLPSTFVVAPERRVIAPPRRTAREPGTRGERAPAGNESTTSDSVPPPV